MSPDKEMGPGKMYIKDEKNTQMYGISIKKDTQIKGKEQSLEINLHIYGQLIYDKGAKNI